MNGAAVAGLAGVWVVALALSVAVGAWLVPWVLRHTEKEPRIEAEAMAVLRGGTWIGVLERLAVTATILAGHPEGVAIVVAVKGLGRYPELKEHPVASERFVVGTLASLVWAGVVGLVARAVVVLLATGRVPLDVVT
ncbi:hypothetical protein [Isoptericola variabilis]|uniref:Uncharacterized protein n=1 Tax=Isoptericola variabilis (strain 225) TaxID=743718 RepID=F6FV26_ISOV2|nr:hypothetical protein [Isoptericola variabilis]AEG44366.1 hypothetical protein Isova_1613 [Isoptericola variabilis 225]TWH34359.1 hypothetical protein L600_001200000150 [Isoptericola variabilis J7]